MSDKPALIWDDGLLTYRELAERVGRLARGLEARGVHRGVTVLLKMHNCREFAETVLALFTIGAVPVLANSLLGAEETGYVAEHSGATAAVVAAGQARSLAGGFPHGVFAARGGPVDGAESLEAVVEAAGPGVAEAVDTRADETAFMVYTSGTTGRPKGIVHAHRWVVALGDANRFRVPPQDGDRVLATGEWSFISSLGHNVLFPLRNGVAGVILEDRPTPTNTLRAIERHRVTLLYSVATVYRRILALDSIESDLSSLRGCNSTGEALETATWRAFKDRVGCDIWEHYGLSEMQMVMGQGPRTPVRPGSVGVPMPGTEVVIVDDAGDRLGEGELGHILIASGNPGFFLGYHRDPERTREVMRDGWYHTGDIGHRDSDGYFWIAGRSDDCFKSRGILISPYEIEDVLRQFPGIVEACVLPLADKEIGNRIRAVCVLGKGRCAGDTLSEEIRSHVRARLAPFKTPHVVEFTDGLPKSAVGKVLRRELAS